MHPQEEPDGLLTSKDIEEIERVKENIKADRKEGTNKVDESITSDCEQLQNKLNRKKGRIDIKIEVYLLFRYDL